MKTAAELSRQPRSHVWHVFACIRSFDLHRLIPRGGVSLYEVARAIHITGIRRGTVVRWINQFAVRPERS